MDPTMLALVIAAALAAFGIKRGARRPPPVEPAPGPEAYVQVSVRPNRLDDGGLRPAVTERERNEDEGAEPADVKETGMSIRARNAMGTSAPADVVGAGGGRDGGGGGTTPTYSSATSYRTSRESPVGGVVVKGGGGPGGHHR